MTSPKSIRFSPEDTQSISDAASKIGTTPTEFIRAAALERAELVNAGLAENVDRLDIELKNHEWLFQILRMLGGFLKVLEEKGSIPSGFVQKSKQELEVYRKQLRPTLEKHK